MPCPQKYKKVKDNQVGNVRGALDGALTEQELKEMRAEVKQGQG